MSSLGKVYLIGAGPGLPSLMTLRGKELLSRAEVLVYDALAGTDFLTWVPQNCEKIYVGKRSSNHSLPQEKINELLAEKALQGKTVIRLKGGDPYVFGRGSEEASHLAQQGIAFEVVPGVTSAIGGLAYAGIPITDRTCNSQFTILTGHEDPTKPESALDYKHLAKTPGTKVILMGMSHLKSITDNLIQHGLSPETPTAVIQWAGTGRQKSVVATLETINQKVEEEKLEAPALIVIGDVVKKRIDLNWYEELPLFGKTIIVTRTREQSGNLTQKLQEQGARVFELPTIKIAPPDDQKAFVDGVISCHTYDWLIFSSPNGVDKFFEAFFKAYSDIRCIGGARIAAIGPSTAAKLKEKGLAVDLVPHKAVAEELIEAFKQRNVENDDTIENMTMLWIHGEQARPVISQKLTEMGAIVDECIAYKTIIENEDPNGVVAQWGEINPDIITFTSSSTAQNFFAMGLDLPQQCRIASIGPITTSTLKLLGHTPDITAESHDIQGLLKAILELELREEQGLC